MTTKRKNKDKDELGLEEVSLSDILRAINLLRKEVRLMRTATSHRDTPGYTNRELMDMFEVSSATLKKWRDNGLLSYSLYGNVYLYSQTDIEKFLQKGRPIFIDKDELGLLVPPPDLTNDGNRPFLQNSDEFEQPTQSPDVEEERPPMTITRDILELPTPPQNSLDESRPATIGDLSFLAPLFGVAPLHDVDDESRLITLGDLLGLTPMPKLEKESCRTTDDDILEHPSLSDMELYETDY